MAAYEPYSRLRYQPMLLATAKAIPPDDDFSFEVKRDGYRMQAIVAAGTVSLISRHGIDFTDDYPGIVHDLPAATGGADAVYDGELVAYDTAGRENFSQIRSRRARKELVLFDILERSGEPLVRLPIEDRRRELRETVTALGSIVVADTFPELNPLLKAVIGQGLEGVVAKRNGSVYLPGKRSPAWQKIRIRPGPVFGHRD